MAEEKKKKKEAEVNKAAAAEEVVEKKAASVKESKKEEPPAKGGDDKPPPEEGDKEENKSEASSTAPAVEHPPPPQEIVLRVFMHCEGCARKVRRCLRGFHGVEDVIADYRESRVVVKGEKADPMKVLERIRTKSHRRVELISTLPTTPTPPLNHKIGKEAGVITAVLGVYMHCDACAQEIKRRIHRMKGVESAEPDLRASKVKVKGVFELQKLVDYVYKRTGKHATVITVEPEKKEEEKPDEAREATETKEEATAVREQENKKEEAKKEEEENNQGAVDHPPAKEEAEAEAEDQKLEVRRNQLYYYHPQNHQLNFPTYPPPRFVHEMSSYPPQIFSDENPNACSVM